MLAARSIWAFGPDKQVILTGMHPYNLFMLVTLMDINALCRTTLGDLFILLFFADIYILFN